MFQAHAVAMQIVTNLMEMQCVHVSQIISVDHQCVDPNALALAIAFQHKLASIKDVKILVLVFAAHMQHV